MISAEGDSLEPKHLERLYVFALMCLLGALLELGDRDRMEEHIRKHTGKEGPSFPKEAVTPCSNIGSTRRVRNVVGPRNGRERGRYARVRIP